MPRQYTPGTEARIPRLRARTETLRAAQQPVTLEIKPIPPDAPLLTIEDAATELGDKLGRGWSRALIYERLKGEWKDMEGYLWANTALQGRQKRFVRIWVAGVLAWARMPK